MLRLAEEIILLLLNEEKGDIEASLSPYILDVVLAGAVLMDLALENRIDTDLNQLMLSDPTPVGDDILDPTLADIAQASTAHPIQFWIAHTAARGEEIRQRALARLIERGILESELNGLFFLTPAVSRSRRYRTQDGETVEEIRLRIMRVLFSDDIPDPHDIVIISLADACDIFKSILSKAEVAAVRERIDLIKQLDLIGHSVTEALQQVGAASPVSVSPHPVREIPQVQGLPLVGNAFGMSGDLCAFLAKQYLKLGPVFGVRAFNRRFIALVGTEANNFMRQEGRTHLRSHEAWVNFNAALGSTQILPGLDGPDHIRLRKVLGPSHSRKCVESHIPEIVEITRREIDQWSPDKPIAARRTFVRLICDQIGLLLAGMSPREYIDDLDVFLDTMLKVCLTQQRPKLWLYSPKFRRARKRIEELSAKVMAQHTPEKRVGAAPDLIDDLIELHLTDPQLMPETNLKINVLGPFFFGLDTMASTCAFMLFAVLKHPDLLERMTAEADALFARGTPTPEAVHQLDVTHRVAMETMRLYPVANVLIRTVSNSFEFAGYAIPAGTNVLCGVSVPHQLPEFFPDPHRFDIDRYTKERAEHRQQGAYAPFGSGTHSCLGSRFVEVQIALVIATILHEAELALDPAHYELKIKHIPNPRPADSFKFRLRRRRQA